MAVAAKHRISTVTFAALVLFSNVTFSGILDRHHCTRGVEVVSAPLGHVNAGGGNVWLIRPSDTIKLHCKGISRAEDQCKLSGYGTREIQPRYFMHLSFRTKRGGGGGFNHIFRMLSAKVKIVGGLRTCVYRFRLENHSNLPQIPLPAQLAITFCPSNTTSEIHWKWNKYRIQCEMEPLMRFVLPNNQYLLYKPRYYYYLVMRKFKLGWHAGGQKKTMYTSSRGSVLKGVYRRNFRILSLKVKKGKFPGIVRLKKPCRSYRSYRQAVYISLPPSREGVFHLFYKVVGAEGFDNMSGVDRMEKQRLTAGGFRFVELHHQISFKTLLQKTGEYNKQYEKHRPPFFYLPASRQTRVYKKSLLSRGRLRIPRRSKPRDINCRLRRHRK